ncbi:hypothetical protein PybrP1_003094 [[Pythium] brassicae (nom. inval.)]|nr:hypothetical protein PybrP1_003094 [[Pythium] brassicae (nom. inval.)]
MASDGAFGGSFAFGGGGASADAALEGLPAFFTSGSVDDKKYESLLADLRAHDLLGPLDGDAGDSAFGGSNGAGAGGSSLFFNDAFSAVFTGTFSESKSLFPDVGSASSSSAANNNSKPPPGFARAPPGLAPSETDLKWARGQQEFSRLEGKFHPTGGSASAPLEKARDDPELAFDESQFLNLSALGLDDDDAVAARSPATKTTAPPPLPPQQQHQQQHQPPQPAPPLPSSLPTPPAPPGGFEQCHQSAPSAPSPSPPPLPPGPWGGNSHPHHQMPPQPPLPPMEAPPPHMYGGGPVHPHQHMQPPPPPPHAFMRGPMPPPPPHGMPFHHHPPPPFAGGPHFPRGAPMLHPPQQQYHHHHPPPPPHFKMMTPRDINFVVQQQMKQIRSSDPFSDDYYFHNYVQKRARGVSAGGNGPGGPRPPALPLPSWKLQHVKSLDPRDAQREAGSRNWESSFHVLGRNNKGSLYRPKQMVILGSGTTSSAPAAAVTDSSSVTVANATDSSSDASTVDATTTVLKIHATAAVRDSVFSNDTWQKRLEIDRGMQCLLSLQDARHILDARGINVQQFHSMDEREIDPSLAALRTRTTALLLELATLLGVAPAAAAHEPQACNLEQLNKMLCATKGKKLVSRALPLLHPSARFVLLPHLVEYLLSARNVSRFASAGDSQDEGDERLCQTLVLTLMYHPLAPPAELFAESLQRAMEGHDLQSLALVLHNRARAEALQALLQRGGAAVQQVDSEQVKRQWEHFQAQFVALATAIKQAA